MTPDEVMLRNARSGRDITPPWDVYITRGAYLVFEWSYEGICGRDKLVRRKESKKK